VKPASCYTFLRVGAAGETLSPVPPPEDLSQRGAVVWHGVAVTFFAPLSMPAGGSIGRPATASREGRRGRNARIILRMVEPPVIAFGPTASADRWWAVLPSDEVLRDDRLTDLLTAVERVMALDHPGRPFTLCLDPTGEWEPDPSSSGPPAAGASTP